MFIDLFEQESVDIKIHKHYIIWFYRTNIPVLQGLKLQINTYSSTPYILKDYFKSSDLFPRKVSNVSL